MSYSILRGDVIDRLRELPGESVHCVVTSPPYWGLRDYGMAGQIGLESTPAEFVAKMVDVFREVRRVLRSDGTAWVNVGDSYASSVGGVGNNPSSKSTLTTNSGRGPKPGDKYAQGNEGERVRLTHGLKPKDLCGIPWRLAFALQSDGWWLRQDIIWNKPNPMPESVTDRCTKAHEYVFLLSKSERYYYDAGAIKEPATGRDPGNVGHKYAEQYAAEDGEMLRTKAGLANVGPADERNKRSVWTVATQSFSEAHFATFPEELITPCILAGGPIGGTVLDPFSGSGTTGVVALRYHREYIGIELNPEYASMSERRITSDAPLFNTGEVTA